MRMFPTMAVTIPINDDQRWSWEWPFDTDMRFSKADKSAARDKGDAVINGVVPMSNVEVDKYIAAD